MSAICKIKPVFLLLIMVPLLVQASCDEAMTSLNLQFNTGNKAPFGLPSTNITIQGKVLPVIFDTGASRPEITLSRYALKGLKVKFTGKSICFNTFDGRHCEKEFIIPQLKIGAFTLNNVKGSLMPKLWGGHQEKFISTQASRDGVIGYELLSKFNVLLDYADSKATLVKQNACLKNINVAGWAAIRFYKHLITHLDINEKSMIVGWDTGAVPSGINRSSVIGMKIEKCPRGIPYDGENCQRVITKEISSSQNKSFLSNTWFLVRDFPKEAPFDALIGSNFYRKNMVYFDFKNHYIYTKPNSS